MAAVVAKACMTMVIDLASDSTTLWAAIYVAHVHGSAYWWRIGVARCLLQY
jgi:hypothetical protein